jgi:hypothetical protein
VHWGKRLANIVPSPPSSSPPSANQNDDSANQNDDGQREGEKTAESGDKKQNLKPKQQQQQQQKSVELVFEDGSRSSPCALVVGCDGIRSKVMAYSRQCIDVYLIFNIGHIHI